MAVGTHSMITLLCADSVIGNRPKPTPAYSGAKPEKSNRGGKRRREDEARVAEELFPSDAESVGTAKKPRCTPSATIDILSAEEPVQLPSPPLPASRESPEAPKRPQRIPSASRDPLPAEEPIQQDSESLAAAREPPSVPIIPCDTSPPLPPVHREL